MAFIQITYHPQQVNSFFAGKLFMQNIVVFCFTMSLKVGNSTLVSRTVDW